MPAEPALYDSVPRCAFVHALSLTGRVLLAPSTNWRPPPTRAVLSTTSLFTDVVPCCGKASSGSTFSVVAAEHTRLEAVVTKASASVPVEEATLINAATFSIDDSESFGTQTSVTVVTCLSNSSCSLVSGKYYLLVDIASSASTETSYSFTIMQTAAAAGVSVSIATLIGSILFALLKL